MSMFLRPRWILVHLVVVALAAGFVSLGLWQLRRLDERRAANALIEVNLRGAAQPLVPTLERFGNDPAALAYRRVVVEGGYSVPDEVLLTPRTHGSRAGHHVVTPLVVAPGEAVLIDRGWVPFDDDAPPIEAAAPPEGTVQVEGILIPTQSAARAGAADPSASRLTFLSTVDVDRLQPQIDLTLYPFSVLLQRQRPAPADLPIPGQPPEVSEGSHLSYAWQWFLFTMILLVGYPLLLRRSLRFAGQRDADRQDEDRVSEFASRS